MSALTVTSAGTWTLDPVHSAIGFELPYLAGTFRGQFTEVEARLTEESLTGSARVASVDVKDENLAAHLQSPEFFDAERYPELRFESRELDRDGEQLAVRGDITIRGVTKPVDLTGTISQPITDAYGRDRIGVKLETTIDRTDFGVNWNMALEAGGVLVGDTVKILIEIEAVKQS